MKGDEDTVIVAAKYAWNEYNLVHGYISKPSKTLKHWSLGKVKYMGFSYDNQIYPLVPCILEVHRNVLWERGHHSGRLGKIVDYLFGTRDTLIESEKLDIYVLSGPQDPETTDLSRSIENDQVSARGLRTAFTRRHRYVRREDLKKATRTSQLKRVKSKRSR